MSEELPTTSDGIVIDSVAFNGAYDLSAYKKGEGTTSRISYRVDEYGRLLRTLWDSYLERGERPALLGHMLTDEGLRVETLHFIAPNSFYAPDGGSLSNLREHFVYWLKTQLPRIREKIGEEEAASIDRETDHILALHSERKLPRK